MKTRIKIKRIYAKPSGKDGYRVLVDRLWPRGLTKEEAMLDEWAKDLAPTPALRKWFGHEPERWKIFKKNYTKELRDNRFIDSFIAALSHQKLITLLYAAKDEAHTHALVLQDFLHKQFND